MVKANELRVNSHVKHVNENGVFYFDVIEILAKGVNVIHNGSIWFIKYEDLTPIPLTEELLIKAGCKIYIGKIKTYGHQWYEIPQSPYQIARYLIRIVSSKAHIGICYNDEPDNIYAFAWEIETLHRLQNITHALTNTELTVK